MASKMRREVARSPISCAVCARRRCVSGSLGNALRAWPAWRSASDPSPAPMAIMPLESASSPRACLRRLKNWPTAAGLDHIQRKADHTNMRAAVAYARMMAERMPAKAAA